MILSLILGSCAGLIYGLFFFHQRRRVLLSNKQRQPLRTAIAYGIARLITIALLWFIVLHYPTLNPILVLVSFLITFWLVVFLSKV